MGRLGCIFVTGIIFSLTTPAHGTTLELPQLSEKHAVDHRLARTCGEFLRILNPIVSQSKFSWASQILNGSRVIDEARASSIVRGVFHDGGLQGEIDAFMAKLGGLQSAELWNRYFEVYDKTVLYSHGYQQILSRSSFHLPKTGKIVDYGAGTGNLSSGLLHLSEGRELVAFDISQTGLKAADAKLKAVSSRQNDYTTFASDLKTPGIQDRKTENADAAIMNNVLYSLPPEERPKVLKRVFNDLKPGGIFVLNDPHPDLQLGTDNAQDFLTRIVVDAAENHSPMTDYDIAFVTAVNRNVLIGGKGANRFLTKVELQKLAEDAGFQLTAYELTYYNRTQMLVLRKPN